ncbi:hypothetical protein [Bordetella avium]|uniref:hypothetical protein n=1 Tax=Bordetella avium TaxID=521 RepID=UPI000FDBEF42|nr:hypothetical protein [Bordetella avium]AZY52832.1 hypothetical protein C0J07_10225 [Bordetella avium]
MPQVPTYNSPVVSPNTLSPGGLAAPNFATPEFRATEAPTFKNTAGAQIERLSESLGHAGNAVGTIANDLVRQANATRVDDAMTQLVKADTDLRVEALKIQGRDAIERPDGKALPDEYLEKFNTIAQGIQDGLGNDAQKIAFRGQSTRLQQSLYGALSMHVSKEWQTYQDQADNAKIDTATQRASAIPNDDATFAQSLGAIEGTVRAKVKRNGGNDEMADVEFRKLRDATYYSRYKAWEQTDPVAALANFQRNQAQISPIMRDRIAGELFQSSAPSLAQAAKPWVVGSGAAPANAPDQAGTPRGIRNNNPGNIVQTANQWQGEVPGNDPKYKTFATPEAGIKAMGDNLLAYQDKYGLNTVSGIVSRWAPATENDTNSYIATVAKALGVKPDDKLNLRDPAVMSKLVGAMIRHENGNQPYSDAQIATGINAALGKAALPAAPGQTDYGYGSRQDGSFKGRGFLGELKRPDGGVMTEYTVGVEIDGKEMDIPTLVPTLTKDEINTLLTIKEGEPIPDDIVQKAVDHAKQRLAEGKGVFADNNPTDAPPVATTPAWRDPNALTGNPIIDNLAPAQRAYVYALAHSQTKQDMAQSRDLLASRVNDAQAEYMATGRAANPPSEAEFIQAYGQADGVQRYQAFQDVATLGQRIQQTKTLSNADLVAMVNNSKPTPGEGFADRQRNYEILQRAVEQTLEDRHKDPVKFALQNPAFGIQPIKDFGDMNALMAEVGKRKGAMNKIAGDYGTPPTLLTNEEATAFGKFLDTLQTPDKARILGNFAAIGDVAGARSLSAQLKDKNNTLAVAALLAAYTTDPTTHWFGPDTPGTNVGQMYLDGKDAIEQKRAKIDAQAEFGIKAQIYTALDGVYQTPQGRDTAAEAAFGIYGKLQADGSGDVERAVDLATGGIMQFNGGKIAKPYGWDDGKFKDAMTDTMPKAIADTGGTFIAGGQQISAADFAKSLPGARLQTFGQGSYLVMAGNDVVRNLDGTPYVLKVAP